MTCEQARQLLLDALTPPADASDASRHALADARLHAQGCAECRAAVDDFERFGAALRDFDHHAAPVGGWTAFGERLTESVHGAGVARRWAGDPARFDGPRRASWRGAGFAAAAACLAVGLAVGFWAGRTGGAALPNADASGHGRPPGTSPSTSARPASFRPTELEVKRGAATFARTAELVGPQMSWMLQSGDTYQVGIDETYVPGVDAAPSDRLLVLRLTALQGDVAVSDADLVIVPGQTAKLVVPLGEGHELRYHVTTSNEMPARLALWAELATPRGRDVLAVVGTTLQLNPGDAVSAGRFAASAGPYDLRVAFADAPRQRPAASGPAQPDEPHQGPP
jgi:hypothetical protein